MGRYLLRRLLISVPVLIIITMIIFLLAALAPGDPLTVALGAEAVMKLTPQQRQAAMAALGLDKPIPIRYLYWLGRTVRGDLGRSLINGRPVLQAVGERVGPTLRLALTATILAWGIGIPLGIFVALKRYTLIDYIVTVLAFLSVSVPVFFLGLGLIYIFSLKLDVLPTYGMQTLGVKPSLGDAISHMVLPVSMLGLNGGAMMVRYSRAAMLDVLHEDYIRTAHAKGLKERVVIARHALRNALIPLVTLAGLSIPNILGGAVLTETVFQWPGMGMLSVAAVKQRDYPMIMGIALLIAVAVLTGNLLADILYAVVDPRIRYE